MSIPFIIVFVALTGFVALAIAVTCTVFNEYEYGCRPLTLMKKMSVVGFWLIPLLLVGWLILGAFNHGGVIATRV